jgi:outer membrane protease
MFKLHTVYRLEDMGKHAATVLLHFLTICLNIVISFLSQSNLILKVNVLFEIRVELSLFSS